MVLVQLLLPVLKDGASRATEVARLRTELIDAFGGVTAYQRAPALGAWVNPDGDVERDDMIMVEVVADTFDRPWWRNYRDQLETRFAQQAILIRALPIEIP